MPRRAIAVALLFLGALLLAQGAVQRATPAPSSAPPVTSPTPTLAAASPTPTVRPIPEGFRVRVPRLAIDLPIAEGDLRRDTEQQQTPEGYAFHLPGTAIPGEGGNTYLYSHARAGMFLALWEARVGDEVLVRAPDGRELRYVVSEVLPRVHPSDVSVAMPTTTERLTLQTSTGADPEDPRFVVIATPAS